MPDFLALVGDTSDGIPGIDGWGEKGATQVLAVHPHLEDIPVNPAEWRVRPRAIEKMSAALNAERVEAQLYRKLATLRLDVPLAEPLDALEWKGAPRAKFAAWEKKVGASLMGRVKKFTAAAF